MDGRHMPTLMETKQQINNVGCEKKIECHFRRNFTRTVYFTLNPGCLEHWEDQCTLYSNQSKLLANNIFILKHLF